MKKRALTVLMLAGWLPMCALIPVWAVVYIITGKFLLTSYFIKMNELMQ